MSKKVVQLQAIIDGVTKKKDGTLTVKLGTQELSPDETALIFEFGNKEVWVALAETPMTQDEIKIPEARREFDRDKTPSEYLRNCQYIYYKTKNNGDMTGFEPWRADATRRLARQYLSHKLLMKYLTTASSPSKQKDCLPTSTQSLDKAKAYEEQNNS